MKIPGDSDGIMRIAKWMDPTLSEPVSDADLKLSYAWSDSHHYWTGRSGDAFREAAKEVRNRSSSAPSFLQDTAEIFRAYANRLRRGQEQFDEYLEVAHTVGLTVVESVIAPPVTWLGYCPTPSAPQREQDEFLKHQRKMASYREIDERVNKWQDDLEKWLVDHMVPLTKRLDEFSSIANLSIGGDDVASAVLTYADKSFRSHLSEYNGSADAMQEAADKFRNGLRSGNPALRALSEAAHPSAIQDGLDLLNDDIRKATSAGKVLPVVGGLITVSSAVMELQDGTPPTEVGANAVGNLAGGGLGAAIGVALGLAPLGVAAAIAGVSWAGGTGAVWLWQAAVPLDDRETLDYAFTDALNGPPPMLVSGPTLTPTGGVR